MLMVKSSGWTWIVRGGIAAGIARLCLLPVLAQPAVTLDGALLTHYVDRGELVVNGPVVQSALTLAGGGLTFGVWVNLDLDDANDRLLEITETELSLAYGVTLDPLDLEFGIRQYIFPEEPGTREVILHAMLMVPLNPAIGVYYDFEEIEGVYIDLGCHHIIDVTPSLALDLRASLGYGDAAANRDAFEFDQDAWRDLNLGATLQYAIDRHSQMSFGGTYWRLVDRDLRDAVDDDGGLVWQVAFQRRF